MSADARDLDRSQRAARQEQRQLARLKGFNANDYVPAASEELCAS